MKKQKLMYGLLGGIIVALAAVLLFLIGSYNTRQQAKAPRGSAPSASVQYHSEKHVSSTQSSSPQQKVELNDEELAVAAYIDSLRGDSLDDKFKTFDELANGQSANPATEQPTIIAQHEDSTFQIGEGKSIFAWYIIGFNNDQIDVNHYTHGQKDFSKSYNKDEIAEQFSNYRPQINAAIQKIQQNQAQNNVSLDDSDN